jgi:hypothetical protein
MDFFQSEGSVDVFAYFLEALDPVVYGAHSRAIADGNVEVREEAVNDFKWGAIVGGVDTGVDNEFSHGDVLVPVFLAVVDVKAEVLLYFLISAFRLPVCLRVIGGGEVGLDA